MYSPPAGGSPLGGQRILPAGWTPCGRPASFLPLVDRRWAASALSSRWWTPCGRPALLVAIGGELPPSRLLGRCGGSPWAATAPHGDSGRGRCAADARSEERKRMQIRASRGQCAGAVLVLERTVRRAERWRQEPSLQRCREHSRLSFCAFVKAIGRKLTLRSRRRFTPRSTRRPIFARRFAMLDLGSLPWHSPPALGGGVKGVRKAA